MIAGTMREKREAFVRTGGSSEIAPPDLPPPADIG
jgi:hypothetical protein